MAKNILYLIILIATTACSSTGLDEAALLQSNPSSSHKTSTKIPENEALWIAKRVLTSTSTRSYIADPTIDYVVSNTDTRSESGNDTLAYVYNFSNQGFAIIATERLSNPVLAFSPTGTFSLENEIVKGNFISNLEDYYDSEDYQNSTNIEDFDACYQSTPYISAYLNQGNPWNKYVVIDHPDCPVGCVAVATANVICNSKIAINYHNTKFQLKSMILAIAEKMNSTNSIGSENVTKSIIKRITGRPRIPKYTYEQAVDSMAKILYLIGLDVNMVYTSKGSGTNSKYAYNLCKSIGINVTTDYSKYNFLDVFNYLQNDHIIYMRGEDPEGGHAWVCDGYSYCVDLYDKTKITKRYIHIDWGWGGSCNGYYNGEVFAAGRYNFEPLNYFAVKRDSNLELYIVEE